MLTAFYRIGFTILFLLFTSRCDNKIIKTTATPLPAEPLQLTTDNQVKYQPAWSHDGTRIAFVAEEPVTRVRKQNIKNNNQELVGHFFGHVSDFRDFALSPNRLFLASVASDWSCVVIHNLITGSTKTIADGGQYASPIWSEYGDQLAYIRRRFDNSEIAVYSFISQEEQILLSHPQHFRRLSWSSNNEFFAIECGIDSTQILSFSAPSGIVETIVPWQFRPVFPAIAPDGLNMAYIAQNKNGMGLSIYNNENSESKKISRNFFIAASPNWTKDANKINFSEENFIATISSDGSEYLRSTIRNTFPVWIKNEDAILVFENTGRAQIRIVNIETREITTVTGVDQPQFESDWTIRDLQPSWSADDSQITFVRFDELGDLSRFLDLDIKTGKINSSGIAGTNTADTLNENQFNAELSRDGQWFVHNNDGGIKITNLHTQSTINLSAKTAEPFVAPTWFSNDYDIAAINPVENRIKLLEVRDDIDSLIITPIDVPGFSGTLNGEIVNIVFSEDHKVLGPRVAFGYDGAIYIFYLKGFKIEQLVAHGSFPAFSPDGESLAYIHDKQIKILRLYHEFQ
ncbi:MAG: hypothetical protein DWQ05_15000 [Calditrichaeota bacterium]|nr:MAG: hypothetical protein DWQ05_15000 [Calditrichota bacterium]